MSDVILTTDEFEALKAVCERASDLVTALPYVTMMGGNMTRQNMTVQALATALETAKGVDFENVQHSTDGFSAAIAKDTSNVAVTNNRRTRTTKG